MIETLLKSPKSCPRWSSRLLAPHRRPQKEAKLIRKKKPQKLCLLRLRLKTKPLSECSDAHTAQLSTPALAHSEATPQSSTRAWVRHTYARWRYARGASVTAWHSELPKSFAAASAWATSHKNKGSSKRWSETRSWLLERLISTQLLSVEIWRRNPTPGMPSLSRTCALRADLEVWSSKSGLGTNEDEHPNKTFLLEKKWSQIFQLYCFCDHFLSSRHYYLQQWRIKTFAHK